MEMDPESQEHIFKVNHKVKGHPEIRLLKECLLVTKFGRKNYWLECNSLLADNWFSLIIQHVSNPDKMLKGHWTTSASFKKVEIFVPLELYSCSDCMLNLSCNFNLRGYCTSGPYFWRLCAFSQKIKQLWTKYPMNLVRNISRNSKITVLLQ